MESLAAKNGNSIWRRPGVRLTPLYLSMTLQRFSQLSSTAFTYSVTSWFMAVRHGAAAQTALRSMMERPYSHACFPFFLIS